jgi:hypothetical protein|eukprot:COSAG01_NODE_1855_length_9052_cov_4.358883_6_plen_56_part_00
MEEYNRDFAIDLRKQLTQNYGKHSPGHLLKMPWVAVLNPNSEEQKEVSVLSGPAS